MFKKLLPSALVSLGLRISVAVLVQDVISAQPNNAQKIETINTSKQAPVKSRGLETMRHFNVAISVPDINASVDWYQRVLGFRKISQSNLSNGASIAMIERNVSEPAWEKTMQFWWGFVEDNNGNLIELIQVRK